MTKRQEEEAESLPKQAKILSFINMKGGVGKTTSSVTVAETLAAAFEKRVLFIDLDAQASASYALCGAETFERMVAEERTLAAFFDRIADGRRPEPLSAYAAPAQLEDGAIDVVCAEPALRFAERALIERCHTLRVKASTLSEKGAEGQTRRIMRDALDQVAERYDVIVLDCPPGISVFAEAGVAASDLIVVPTIPDYLSTLGLKELNARFLKQMRRDGNLSGAVAILPSKVRAGDPTHRRYLKQLDDMVRSGEVEARLLMTHAPQDAAIARALEPEQLGARFAKKYGKAKTELVELVKEIRELIDDVDDPRRGRPRAGRARGGFFARWRGAA